MSPALPSSAYQPLLAAAAAAAVLAATVVSHAPARASVLPQESQDAVGREDSLSVHVTNGTASASNDNPFEVTLQAFNGDSEIARWTGETDRSGAVEFDLVVSSPGLVYVASTDHRGVRYFGEPVSLSDDAPQAVEVTVYDVTSDPGMLRLTGDNMVILGPDGDSGTLRMMQITTVENVGDRTFIGSEGDERSTTMRLPLPDQAFDVEALHDPGSLVIDPDTRRLYSTRPVLPGPEDLIFTYRLLYRGSGHEIGKDYPYPADAVRLLVPDGISPLLGEAWTTRGQTEIAGAVYRTFVLEGGVSEAGMRLSAQLAGLPISAGERSRAVAAGLRYGAVVTGAVAVAGSFAYGWHWSRRRSGTVTATASNTRSSIIEDLTALQLAFEAGDLTEADYRAAREERGAALRRRLGEDGP